MKVLSLAFLLLLAAKVVLIGIGNVVTQAVIPLALAALVALMLLLSAGARAALPRMVTLGPVALMVALAAVSGLAGAYHAMPAGNGLTAIMRVTMMLTVMAGAYLAVLAGHARLAAGILYLTFLVHIVAAIVLYFAGVGYEIGGVLRPTGITGRPQLIANIASLAMVYYLCRMLFVTRRATAGAVLMLALALGFVLLSGTLKNFIAVMLAGFVALAGVRTRHRRLLFVAGVAVLALVARVAWTELPIGARLSEAIGAGLSTDVAVGDRLESSLMWRMLHWKLLLTDWYANYRWSGAGIGQVVMLDALKGDSGQGFIAHSDWVGLLVELGIVLFVAFVATQLWFYAIIRAQCRRGIAEFDVLRVCYLLVLVMSVAGNVFYSAAFQYQFWWMVGMSAAAAETARRNRLDKS